MTDSIVVEQQTERQQLVGLSATCCGWSVTVVSLQRHLTCHTEVVVESREWQRLLYRAAPARVAVTRYWKMWHNNGKTRMLSSTRKAMYTVTDRQTDRRREIDPFNGPLSRTTQASRYQKGKTNLDFTEARDSESQWYQLGHMQVCTSLHTDNHASTPLLCFLQTGCPSCRPTNSIKALKSLLLLLLQSDATKPRVVSLRGSNFFNPTHQTTDPTQPIVKWKLWTHKPTQPTIQSNCIQPTTDLLEQIRQFKHIISQKQYDCSQ